MPDWVNEWRCAAGAHAAAVRCTGTSCQCVRLQGNAQERAAVPVRGRQASRADVHLERRVQQARHRQGCIARLAQRDIVSFARFTTQLRIAAALFDQIDVGTRLRITGRVVVAQI